MRQVEGGVGVSPLSFDVRPPSSPQVVPLGFLRAADPAAPRVRPQSAHSAAAQAVALGQLRAQTAVGSLRRALARTEQQPHNSGNGALGGGTTDRTQEDKLQQRAAHMLAPRALPERQIAKAAAAAAKSATLRASSSAGGAPLRSSKKGGHPTAKGHPAALRGTQVSPRSGHSVGSSSSGGHGHMPREPHH